MPSPALVNQSDIIRARFGAVGRPGAMLLALKSPCLEGSELADQRGIEPCAIRRLFQGQALVRRVEQAAFLLGQPQG